MKALVIEPGKQPRTEDISPDLKSLQREVGGYIQAVYPWDDPVAIICNEEAKLEGLPMNRALRDEGGEVYDIIAGTFLITGLTEDDFGDLTDDLIEKYTTLFRCPEGFIHVGDRIIVNRVPV